MALPHPTIFFEPPAPYGVPHLKLKNEGPHLNPPPLKHESPFHKMIPRKSTINNLKSS